MKTLIGPSLTAIQCITPINFTHLATTSNLQGLLDCRSKFGGEKMKLATLRGNGVDGELVVVSRDMCLAVRATGIAETLLKALEEWDICEPELRDLYTAINERKVDGAFPFDPRMAWAPLPRAPQWCDGSAFLSHARLMAVAFDTPLDPDLDETPLMYQGSSDDFRGPHADIELPDEAHGIDFEGEFGVIVDNVPMGCPAQDCLAHVRLIVQLNDVSLRSFGPKEMRTGFGFFNAKPTTSFAPLAITPDELGSAWAEGRVNLPLKVEWNGEWFGNPHGNEMWFGFDRLIEHAAKTRKLTAGTIVGSGTVSNKDRTAGSACISEQRAIEVIEGGSARTRFMRFGDKVRMEARADDGTALFGAIDQRIVQYSYVK